MTHKQNLTIDNETGSRTLQSILSWGKTIKALEEDTNFLLDYLSKKGCMIISTSLPNRFSSSHSNFITMTTQFILPEGINNSSELESQADISNETVQMRLFGDNDFLRGAKKMRGIDKATHKMGFTSLTHPTPFMHPVSLHKNKGYYYGYFYLKQKK